MIKLKDAKQNCFAYKEGGCQATINETCSNCNFLKRLNSLKKKQFCSQLQNKQGGESMSELTHEQYLWINLLTMIASILAAFIAGEYILDKQEEKEHRQEVRYNRRRRKLNSYKQQQAINNVYASLGNFVHGMDKLNAVCNTCKFKKDGKCYCKDKIAVFKDDTGGIVECKEYCKKECEKRTKK